jgi:hypothetical protein
MGKLKKIQVHMDNMLGHKVYTTAIMHEGYFKENKQFLHNVLLFASSNMATLSTQKCLTYSAQNKHYSSGLPVQLENCYRQTILAQGFRNGKMYYVIRQV